MKKRPDQKSVTLRIDVYQIAEEKAKKLGKSISALTSLAILKFEVPTQ